MIGGKREGMSMRGMDLGLSLGVSPVGIRVKHLTFDDRQFLKVLKDVDPDECVIYVANKLDQVWLGISTDFCITICLVTDVLEVYRLMRGFCPVFRED